MVELSRTSHSAIPASRPESTEPADDAVPSGPSPSKRATAGKLGPLEAQSPRPGAETGLDATSASAGRPRLTAAVKPLSQGPSPTSLQRATTGDRMLKAEVDRALGEHLKACLGGINPLDAATTVHQRERMLHAIKELRLKAEIAVVDEHGNLSPMDQAVFDEIYTKNFPATEAVPVDTITAAMSARQKDGTHLDGKRFTLCYSGVLPGEGEDKRRPIAFAQGGTLDAGPEGVVSFAEYLAVNDEFRGHGMLHVMLGFVNATSMAAVAKENQTTGGNKTLLGSVWEIDPKGRGESAKDRLYTPVRNAIYDRAGAFVVMGLDQEGQLHPVHAQPDVTPDGDCGDWHLHFVFRPQNPERVQFDKAKLLAASRSYDRYFADWAATGKRGVNAQTIASAADYKHSLHRRFDEVSLIQPSKAPADWDMARGDALIAKIVAEDFGLSRLDGKPHEDLDYSDPVIRDSIADRAAAAYERERLDARATA